MKHIETQNVEFKEKFGNNVLKTLFAFANTQGGKVMLGVKNNGTVKGFKVSNEALRDITEKIVSKLGIHSDIEVKENQGKQVVEIKVNKSNALVSFEGKYYERIGNTTREMKSERLREFFIKGTNWDTLINEEAEFNEIDEQTVRMGREKGRLRVFDENTDIKVLFEHLKLSSKSKLTNGAIILFGKDPQKYFLNAVLRVIRLKNETTSVGERLIDGDLFKQVMEGEEAIKNFLGVRYEIKNL